MLIGVDEAGRGPVLGSMFVAAVGVDTRDDLPEGIRDSKQLSTEQREALAQALETIDSITIHAEEVPAAEIDAPRANLNALTVEAAARAIRAVMSDPSGEVECFLDACDV